MANGKMWKRNIFWFDPPITSGTVIVVPKKVEKESKFWEHSKDFATIITSVLTTMVLLDKIIDLDFIN